MKQFITNNFEETQKLAEEFGQSLKPGAVIALYGDLGAGKTTFVQGLAKGLGIKQRIISPTFIIVRKYEIDSKKIKTFYHIDLYRMENERDLEGLGLEEILNDKDAIVAIEWAEKLGPLLPAERIDIEFENLEDDKRKIRFSSLVSSDVLASRPGSPLRALDETFGRSISLRNAIEVFKNGGVVIFPTDTAFGIGCRIDNEEAVKRVFDIKKRDYSKPLLALVDSIEMAEKYVEIPADVRAKLLNIFWPGGLTVLLKCNKEKVPDIVRSGGDSLAVRLPNHDEIRSIIKEVGVPIIAPSANISEEQTPYSLSEVNEELKSEVDFVLDGECTYKKQSTIIDCTQNPWEIVREGAATISL